MKLINKSIINFIVLYRIALTIPEIILLSMLFGCQKRNKINTTISEKNNELSIHVDADKNWKHIHYDKTFGTKGLAKSQRDSIVHHVFDSLHLGINESK